MGEKSGICDWGSVQRCWLVLLLLPLLFAPRPAAAQDCGRISADDWDDIRFFRQCLTDSNPADWPAPSGNTLLHNAAGWTRNPTIVVLLLEAGFDPNARNDNGTTPLHMGVQNGNPVVTSHLLAAGSDPNAVDNDGYTPLHLAHWNENARVTVLLLDAGADPHTLSNDGWTPFHSAVFSARSRSLSEFLDQGGDFGLTPLHEAIVLGDTNTAMSLLAEGTDARVSDDYGWSALHFAVSMGKLRIAIALLDVDSDPNARTESGLSALHLAAEPRMVEALVAAGAEIDIPDSRGWTPLHQAAAYRDAPVVQALLDAGSDPTLTDDEGNRPADLVERNSRIEAESDVVRWLRGRAVGSLRYHFRVLPSASWTERANQT